MNELIEVYQKTVNNCQVWIMKILINSPLSVINGDIIDVIIGNHSAYVFDDSTTKEQATIIANEILNS